VPQLLNILILIIAAQVATENATCIETTNQNFLSNTRKYKPRLFQPNLRTGYDSEPTSRNKRQPPQITPVSSVAGG
jgi:hypothetical protein